MKGLKVVFRKTVKCGLCKRKGHNRQTCEKTQTQYVKNVNTPLKVDNHTPRGATSGETGEARASGVGEAYGEYIENFRLEPHDGSDVFNPYRLTSVPAVINFSTPTRRSTDIEGVSGVGGESYTLEELSTLWEITLDSEPETERKRFGWQERWWAKNLTNLIEPLKQAGEVNIEDLREELAGRVENFGGVRGLVRRLIKEMRSASSEGEEIFHLKVLATVWPKLTREDLLTVSRGMANTLPFPVYNALLSSGDNPVLIELNKRYISKLENGGQEGVPVFRPTPLTRTIMNNVSEETIIAEYNMKVREVLNEKIPYNTFLANPAGVEGEITMVDIDRMEADFDHLKRERRVTKEEYETKITELNSFRARMRKGGGGAVTGQDLVKVSQVFKVRTSEGAKIIPESEVTSFYFNGSLRDKQMAVMATRKPETLRSVLTDTTTPAGMSKGEWWEGKKAIIRMALKYSSTRIDKETFNYILEKWGHEEGVRDYMLERLERKPSLLPNATLTVSEWYIYSERLKRRRLSDIFKKGIFGWFWKRLGEW